MKYLLVALLFLSGCKMNTPVSQFDSGIDQLCEGGLQEYQGHQFNVNLMDTYGELRAQCNGHAACTNGNSVWVIAGPKCPQAISHELNHIIGNDWVDAHKE